MMRLSIRGMAAACALLWGGAVFFGGACHAIWPSYGTAFLSFAASIYPGYHPESGLSSVVVGTLYGIVDAAAAGALFAWIYNRTAGFTGN